MAQVDSLQPSIDRPPELDFLLSASGTQTSKSAKSVGTLCAIQAPSGIGKTHLVDSVIDKIQADRRSLSIRLEAPSSLTQVSFSTIMLSGILRSYIEDLSNGSSLPSLSQDLFSSRRRSIVAKGAKSVVDGVTFGAASAIQSIFQLIQTRKVNAVDELELDNIEMEETLGHFASSLSKSVTFVAAIANAQRLSKRDLEFIASRAASWKARVFLEYTMPSFSIGAIDRENLNDATRHIDIDVAAMTLSPVGWDLAHQLNNQLASDDSWARNYYERNGYNLFDLMNLTSSEQCTYQTMYFEDVSFGPIVIPGLTNKFSATASKILNLTREEQFLLCLLSFGPEYVREDILTRLAPGPNENLNEITSSLLNKRMVTLRPESADIRAYALAHESIRSVIQESPAFITQLKLAASTWQSFYSEQALHQSDGAGPFRLELLIRYTFFSALVSDSGALLSGCQELAEASKTAVVEGEFRASFLRILDETRASSLIPQKIKDLIFYNLGAAALNFGDLEIAERARESMTVHTQGAQVLQLFTSLREKNYDEMARQLNSLDRSQLDRSLEAILSLLDTFLLSLTARSSEQIGDVRRSYRRLLAAPHNADTDTLLILKHAAVGLGYSKSIPVLDQAISELEKQGKLYDADQARLIKLMQLTRLGHLTEARTLANYLENKFPRNFGEIANYWNINAILDCYDESSAEPLSEPPSSVRDNFLRALNARQDDYSKIVVWSNIFAFDHFLSCSITVERDKEQSARKLIEVIDTSELPYKYLYYLGWFNLMKFHEITGDKENAERYRERIGKITKDDALLWQVALGKAKGTGTEVEFLTKTPFMFAFIPNYEFAPPTFSNRVDSISRIISS